LSASAVTASFDERQTGRQADTHTYTHTAQNRGKSEEQQNQAIGFIYIRSSSVAKSNTFP